MSGSLFDTDLRRTGGEIVRATGRIAILEGPRRTAPFEIGALGEAPPQEAATPPSPPPPPAFSETDLARVCAAVHARGAAEGRRAALAERAERETAALGAIAAAMEGVAEAMATIRAEALARARTLGLELARAMVPAALADRPLADLEELLRLCVERLQDEPRLEVRIHTDLVEPCRERLEALAASVEYRGEIVVHGDETMGPGDLRLRWADGGAERRLEALRAEAEAVVARWLPLESD